MPTFSHLEMSAAHLSHVPEGGMSILASTVAICPKTFLLTLTSRVSTEVAAATAFVMAATAGSPAKAVRRRASQGRDDVATDVPTPDCNSCPFDRSRSEIKLEEKWDTQTG